MTCPICNDTGYQVINTLHGEIKLHCRNPICSKSIEFIGSRAVSAQELPFTIDSVNAMEQPKLKLRTKTTTIPDAGLFCPDDDDNRLVDSCDVDIEDTITDMTYDKMVKEILG